MAVAEISVDDQFNAATRLLEQHRFVEAHTEFGKIVRAWPGFAAAQNNFGNACQALGLFADAEVAYRNALKADGAFTDALFNLAILLYEHGCHDEWRPLIDRCLQVNPQHTGAMLAKVICSLPAVPSDAPMADASLSSFDFALYELERAASSPIVLEALGDVMGNSQPYYMAYRSGSHRDRLARYGSVFARAAAARWVRPAPVKPAPLPERVRLLVVTKHIRKSSVWDVILHGFLKHIDKRKFDVVVLPMGGDGSTEAVRQAEEYGVLVRQGCVSMQGALAAVEQVKPDAIFYPEIGMNPLTCKLAAMRLAPLQVAGWGHPLTTGLPTIDLFFSGELLEAEDAQLHYSEKLVRLPGTGVCTIPPAATVEPIDPSLFGEARSAGVVRFLLCQLPFKFDPVDDDLYPKIAIAADKCEFWLVRHPRYESLNKILRARLERSFKRYGLDSATYLKEIPWMPAGKFYGMLDHMDVYLDCPAFSGYTTAWQAIHRGIPIVTLEGQFLRQRLASGLLRQVGVIDSIAQTRDEYVYIAAALAEEARDVDCRAARRRLVSAAAIVADNQVGVVKAAEAALLRGLQQIG